jgi:hypothetical protein
MTTGRILSAALLVLLLVAAGGCGSGQTKVSGKVTVNDKPLEKGNILFVPSDGKGQSEGGEIVNGQYSVKLTPGPKKVEITATKVIGKVSPYGKDGPEVDQTADAIPAEYNRETKLTADVKAGMSELPPFNLKVEEK